MIGKGNRGKVIKRKAIPVDTLIVVVVVYIGCELPFVLGIYLNRSLHPIQI